jgi:hypothetical protein
MSIASRITRAGFAFLLFGAIAAVLPDSGTAVANAGSCSSSNKDAYYYGGAGIGALAYLDGRQGGGGIFPHRHPHTIIVGPNGGYTQVPSAYTTPMGSSNVAPATAQFTSDSGLMNYMNSTQAKVD